MIGLFATTDQSCYLRIGLQLGNWAQPEIRHISPLALVNVDRH
jgi:hypothetical protein